MHDFCYILLRKSGYQIEAVWQQKTLWARQLSRRDGLVKSQGIVSLSQ